MKGKRLKEERGSESETGASSGPVSLKSSQIASGILSSTHPSLGCSNLARQEKLQVTKLQASTTEELIITSIWLFDSWDVFKLCLLFQEKEWEEKSVKNKQVWQNSFTDLLSKGIAQHFRKIYSFARIAVVHFYFPKCPNISLTL